MREVVRVRLDFRGFGRPQQWLWFLMGMIWGATSWFWGEEWQDLMFQNNGSGCCVENRLQGASTACLSLSLDVCCSLWRKQPSLPHSLLDITNSQLFGFSSRAFGGRPSPLFCPSSGYPCTLPSQHLPQWDNYLCSSTPKAPQEQGPQLYSPTTWHSIDSVNT